MAKFLNKKEQVIDFKLTSYGHYLLSNGSFKPEYYSFFDDNVIYDIQYVNGTESQNNIHKRIKNETPYLESVLMFEEVENSPNTIVTHAYGEHFEVDVTPIELEPRKTAFRLESMIGDAFLEGDTNSAPAWKASLLNGQILNSTNKDTKNNILIPQVNIDANYILKVIKPNPLEDILSNDIGEYKTETDFFADGRQIVLENDNTMIYLEELNTMLLNENFEIEVYEVGVDEVPITHKDGSKTDLLKRKTFAKQWEALKGSEITDEYFEGIDKIKSSITPKNENQVEYYFNIRTDEHANKKIACKGIDIFNKDSYYIDLDFECDNNEIENIYYDIYGPVTEPEICP